MFGLRLRDAHEHYKMAQGLALPPWLWIHGLSCAGESLERGSLRDLMWAISSWIALEAGICLSSHLASVCTRSNSSASDMVPARIHIKQLIHKQTSTPRWWRHSVLGDYAALVAA